jgi:AcrR family transcriptional regulator
MNLAEELALERRERILASVRQCIIEKDVASLTIRDLAKDCRVSVATLYRSFGGKEQLLVEAIRPYFESVVLGSELDGDNLYGADRLLAVLDLCGKTLRDMPEYNQKLFTLFMGSEFGEQLAWDITETISAHVHKGLLEIQQNDELHDWVNPTALAERVAAQCIIVSVEYYDGNLSMDGFVAANGYSASLLMLGATSGKAQQTFMQRAQETQNHALRQPNARLHRSPGKIGGES